MPQIAGAVAGALIKIGVSKAIAAAIGSFVVKLAVSVAASALMRGMQPKPRGMQQGQELATKLDPAYPREVGVGKFATGGSLAFENVSGANNRYLWRVIALSDCEIEEITQVRGNGEALTFSGDIHTGLRECTSHFQDDSGNNELSLRIYKGTQSQTADADLLAAFPSMLDSNFRGRGVAYALVKMTYSKVAWQSGMELVFVGKGALIEDTRTATTAWTENLALIARAFVLGFENNGIRVVGLGCDDANDIPVAELEAAADECDEAVSLAAGGTEAKYRGGGMISARESAREVLSDLCAAMGGAHADIGGQITLLPGVARTPIMDIAEEDLLADEGVVYVGRRTADERVNCISSTFVNPDDGWQEAPLPPRKDTAAITADGARYETHRAYRFVQSKTQGQRLDEIELRRARCEGFFAFSAPLWAFELGPGDWFTATNKRWGNVEKTFEVETINLAITSGKAGGAAQARCAVTAREISAEVFDWDTTDEITTTAGTITQPGPLGPLINDDDVFIGDVDGIDKGAINDIIDGTYITGGGTAITSTGATATDATWQDVAYVDIVVSDTGFVHFPQCAIDFEPAGTIPTSAGIRIVESDTSGAGPTVVVTDTQVLSDVNPVSWRVPLAWAAEGHQPATRGATRRFTLQVNRTSGSGTVDVSIGNATLGAGLWLA